MPAVSYLPSLMAELCKIADPRQRRGVRHPFSGILGLVLLGLVCRLSEFAELQRFAVRHWPLLRRALGFKRGKPPHATTLSRTLAKFSLEEFQAAFSRWLQVVLADPGMLAVAVDGKTSKQGFDAQGHPIQMLNVFAQDLKACLGQWPLAGDKSTEPEVLKAHLSELFEKYPALRLITGDALYAQRNLAEIIVQFGHDYLFQIKGNQPDILDVAQTCFAQAVDRKPDAQTHEKKGRAGGSFSVDQPGRCRICPRALGFCRLPNAAASRSGDEGPPRPNHSRNPLLRHQPRSGHHHASAVVEVRPRPLAGGEQPALRQGSLVG